MPKRFKPTGSAEIIRQKIHFIRGHKVMRDSDLAELYADVARKLEDIERRQNEQERRIDRVPRI